VTGESAALGVASATPTGAGVGGGLELVAVNHWFSARRGTTHVLRDVSFAVRDGEFVVVMGPSGCGKSTLVGFAAGFTAPSEGTVRWENEPVTAPTVDKGVVFQKPALYPWLDVWGNVMFGPRLRRKAAESEAWARELVAEVGLEGFERHRAYELSGGMQHRVALARTMVNDPDLLLMDEPFAALDAQTREDMQELLIRVWERHRRTVLFVTHDIEEGLLLADRLIVLTHRPATVNAVIDVDFPRPRSYDIVLDPRFAEMRQYVRRLLARAT
jgi:NitT/TauT family transport system ATP-binding protein